MSDWNINIINDFRSMRGKAKDHRVGGMFPHDRMVLLHTTGAKSGKERVTPLAAWRDNQRLYVTGSAGGGPKHPAWFHNILAHPEVTVEVDDETRQATAQNIDDRAERDAIYQKFIELAPQFAEYEKSAGDRVIPVVAIEPVEE